MERLELAGIEVEALSIGGVETTLRLPRFKLAFDIGRCPPEVVSSATVLFTHGHMDHLGGVAYHCSTRAMRHMPPPTYVVPPVYESELEALFAVWRRLDHSDMTHTTVALGPGDALELRPDLVVRPFPTFHTAPSQGYALYSRRKRLLPEHAGRSGPEIAALKRQGVEVEETVEVPEVAYCGDTRIEVVDEVPVVRTARLLILEATFLDERVPVDQARARGHVHLDEIVERAERFENHALLLHHFSARYRAGEIRTLLERRLPEVLQGRVVPLCGGH